MSKISIEDVDSFNHRELALPTRRNRKYHLVDENSASEKVILCFHGFPETWHGWRFQIQHFVSKGFRVIVPTLLGYGNTDAPADVELYSLKSMADDMAALLDEIKLQHKVIVLGHDWGGLFAWRFAQFHPDKVLGAISICTPYFPLAQADDGFIPAENIADLLPHTAYQLPFHNPDNDSVYEENIDHLVHVLHNKDARAEPDNLHAPGWAFKGVLHERFTRLSDLRRDGKLPEITHTDPAAKYHAETLKRQGLTGPLNWYRATKFSFDEEQKSGLPVDFPGEIPALFITVTEDEALPLFMSNDMENYFAKDGLKKVIIEGADHWVIQDEQYIGRVHSEIESWINVQRFFKYDTSILMINWKFS